MFLFRGIRALFFRVVPSIRLVSIAALAQALIGLGTGRSPLFLRPLTPLPQAAHLLLRPCSVALSHVLPLCLLR
jgi:hypothetical protein